MVKYQFSDVQKTESDTFSTLWMSITYYGEYLVRFLFGSELSLLDGIMENKQKINTNQVTEWNDTLENIF